MHTIPCWLFAINSRRPENNCKIALITEIELCFSLHMLALSLQALSPTVECLNQLICAHGYYYERWIWLWTKQRCRWVACRISGVNANQVPGSKVRLLLSVWIKSRCSFAAGYVANPDHNRWQGRYCTGDFPRTIIPATPALSVGENFSSDTAGHMALILCGLLPCPETAKQNRCLPARFK
jgi:hypothetical protein